MRRFLPLLRLGNPWNHTPLLVVGPQVFSQLSDLDCGEALGARHPGGRGLCHLLLAAHVVHLLQEGGRTPGHRPGEGAIVASRAQALLQGSNPCRSPSSRFMVYIFL